MGIYLATCMYFVMLRGAELKLGMGWEVGPQVMRA